MQYIGNPPQHNVAYLPEVSVKDNLLDEWVSDGTLDEVSLDISSLSPDSLDNLVVTVSGSYHIVTMEHNDATETYQCVFTTTLSSGATVSNESYPYLAVNASSRGGDAVANVAIGKCSGGGWYMNWQSFENHYRVGVGHEIIQWNVIAENCTTLKPTSLKFLHDDAVAGTTVFPAGFTVRVYRRDMESKQVVYTPQNGGIQKNYLHNTGNWVNQKNYDYSSAVTTVSEILTDRWLCNDASGTKIEYLTPLDPELMTITGAIYQGLELNDLQNKVCVLSWEGTSQCSVFRANGDSYDYSDSPLVFTMPEGLAGVMEYVSFNAGTLKHMKLEIGEIPTPWEPEDVAEQQIICKRFFERIKGVGTGETPLCAGYASTTTNAEGQLFYQKKRITPTITISNNAGLNIYARGATFASSGFAVYDKGLDACWLTITTAGLTVGDGLGVNTKNGHYVDVYSELL